MVGRVPPPRQPRLRRRRSAATLAGMRSPALPAYRALLEEAGTWFERAAAAHAADVRCGRGCDACCHGLFDVSPLDAALIAEGVRAAGAETRAALAASAAQALATVAELAPQWRTPWRIGDLGVERFDALCDALPDAPCPALDDAGACRIYAHRPLVCRLHGLPMFDPGTSRDCGGACPLNAPLFGLDADALRARPALHFDHAAFEADERALLAVFAGPAAAADPEPFGTIVAAAIQSAAVRK